jgi:hypothetical protein
MADRESFALLVAHYADERSILVARGARLRASSERACAVFGDVERRRGLLSARAGTLTAGTPIGARPGAGSLRPPPRGRRAP